MTDATLPPLAGPAGVQAILAGFRSLGIAASVYDSAIVQEASRQPALVNVTLSQLITALETINIRVISPMEQMDKEDQIAPSNVSVASSDLTDLLDDFSIDSDTASTASAVEVADDANSVVANPIPEPVHTPSDPNIGVNPITGFVCAQCNAHNLVRPASETWYTVIAGRSPGVYKDWSIVHPLVMGVSRACFKKHKSEAEARSVFAEAAASGVVRVLP
ncbi:hypothetical protein D9613_008309 [Agrocybe pediades]|uniref:Ribonuclease H1 N-terminal domain-containing protein n=1 Tax=Agrocybe pediades TaxID=84607 RepID=A0A8H4QSK4_9AGAR|nr:hypothetical protein D9613_008309 [Agrocybe pediades]